MTTGSAASAAEARKHATNDAKCNRLGWVCIPLAVGPWRLTVVGETKPLSISRQTRRCTYRYSHGSPKIFGCVGSVRKAKHRPSQSECKGHIS